MASLESSWSYGYVTEVDYTRGFYTDMAPEWLSFVATVLGFESPPIDGAFRYLELGCGKGYTTNLLAAAHPRAEFVANDMNASHVQSARRHAREAGLTNVTILEKSFEELASQDIGTFDFITMHGVLSWVSRETEQQIVRILRERLNPGGLVYVSYNCLPGWAAQEPLRRLFVEEAARRSGPLEHRVAGALQFAQSLKSATGYFKQTPSAAARLDEIAKQRQDYVTHEFFNRDWRPLYHLDVRRAFADAKLAYVGTTPLVENTDAIIPAEIKPLFVEIQDAEWKEQVRDYITNRQFRADVYVRGACRLSPPRQRERLDAVKLSLAEGISDFDYKMRLPPFEVTLDREIYSTLFRALEGAPLTMREIVEAAKGKLGEQHVREACFLTAGLLRPATPAADASIDACCARFNAAALRDALVGEEVPALASPILGSGLRFATPDVIAFKAMQEGGTRDEVVDRTMTYLVQADRLKTDPSDAAGMAKARAVMAERVEQLATHHAPVWKRLGIRID